MQFNQQPKNTHFEIEQSNIVKALKQYQFEKCHVSKTLRLKSQQQFRKILSFLS